MKQRFGGLLCLTLGGVLIAGGSFGLDAGAGNVQPSCGGLAVGTPTPTCPTGALHLSETTTGSGTPPVAGWSVDITSSNCKFPGTSATTLTVLVPDDGSINSPSLYQNTDGPETTPCSYSVVQSAVAGFDTTYDPEGPYALPQLEDNSAVTNVGLMNASAVVATPSPTPVVTASPTPSASPATSPPPIAIGAVAGNGGGAVPTLPMNGASRAHGEIAAGVALVALGGFLLLVGRRPESD